MSEITRERVHLYRQKLLLYLLDDDDSHDIMIPYYTWYDKFRLRSRFFQGECERLYKHNVPECLVDVAGDGNCLYYCMLLCVLQLGYLNDEWLPSCHPAVWMRQKIHKGANEMELGEWLKVSMQNDKEFIDAELKRIYNPQVDYMDGTKMGESDDCYGSTVKCFVFSKLYSLVVVLYICDSNPSVSNTVIMDGRPDATESILHLQGIHPEKVPPSATPVL
jgi:hypothetical protein